MSESSDSPNVQAFMAAFQKLRNLVDDKPEVIASEARKNESLGVDESSIHCYMARL